MKSKQSQKAKGLTDTSSLKQKVNLFYLLILLLPTQLAYHFWLPQSFIFGIRVDYLAPTIYFTDLLVFLLFLFSVAGELKKLPVPRLVFVFVLAVCVLNLLFSVSPLITLYRLLKLIEFSFLAYWVNKHKSLIVSKIHIPLVLSLLLELIIAFLQLINQRTTGSLLWLLGERTFTSETPGIAKYALLGKDSIRPYATFPHPNALAGYALVVFFLLLALGTKNKISKTGLILSILLVIVSGSLNAYLVLFIASFLYIFRSFLKQVAVKNLLLSIVLLISFTLPLLPNLPSYPKDINERIVLAKLAVEMWKSNPLFGIGLGNFITALPKTGLSNNVIWLLQPVHNIYLLILSETGLVGFILLFVLMFKTFKNSLKIIRLPAGQENYKFIIPLLCILYTGLFDHYWVTLQQNSLLFAVIIGLSKWTN